MTLLNSIASWWMKKRMHQIELFMKYPLEVQHEWLKKMLEQARDTSYGKHYNFAAIENEEQFKRELPLQDYESLKATIDEIRKGKQNSLWPTEIRWFAKSSGTTNDKSKFIPVSEESLKNCHYNGGRDMISIYCSLYPETKLFTGKNLALAGSLVTDYENGYTSQNGDLSAIVINNLPVWAEFFRAPDMSIALMDNWDEKLERIVKATIGENMVSLAGVPSWMLLIVKRVLEETGKRSIREVWPNLEVYFHGGVNFNPYRPHFKSLFASEEVHFLELYNATEGFFGIQDQRDSDELLLMLDYGIYYEFIELNDYSDTSNAAEKKIRSLEEVEPGINYEMVISTTAGLWRYRLGDTIVFTSLYPFRFRITGRTKQFINVFGEELIVDNAEKALAIACERTGASVNEYTAGPVFMDEKGESGAHEWFIEFEQAPENILYFGEVLDNALKAINSDYEAKRYHNLILQAPQIKQLPQGSFYKWLEQKNKLGAQHKVPRLSNDRKYLEQLAELAGV